MSGRHKGTCARQYARANVHAPWGATSGRRGPRGTLSSHYADLGRMIRLPCSIRRMQTRTNVHLWCRFKEVSTLSKTRAYFTKISKAIKRDEAHTTHRTRLHTQQYTVCTGYTAAGQVQTVLPTNHINENQHPKMYSCCSPHGML